jgi:YafQ family addiction module toxin component
MPYTLEINPKCEESMRKLCKKNPVLEKILRKKINEIRENPEHYKPLKYGLAGERRVHILKSFVLKYDVKENTIRLLFFGHHDEAYVR